ncbi:MAG: MFS transporter [Deltaproteobacteria bacterium]|nr:MFS transporter [Deltaproteobacteria bacterium]
MPQTVSDRQAKIALGILSLVYAINLLDRQILSMLLVPIQEDLGVSDTALGFLTGTSFALFYATAGIPIARWADRGTRTHIIAIGLVLWSAATAACGLARSFAHLAIARVLVGVGEAAGSPPSHSLIADYFPPERRARSLALYTMGASVGLGLGYALGGSLGERFGWRITFFVVGVPGVLMALVVRFGMKEPARGASEGRGDIDAQPPMGMALRQLAGIRSYRHIALATALYNLASYGFMMWVPTFLIRVHEVDRTESGVWLGLIAAGCGLAGAYTGGWLADFGAARDRRWFCWLPACAGLLATPFIFAFLLVDTGELALLCYAPITFISATWSAPTFAAVQGLVPLRMRSMASAVLLFVLNLIGLGLGPQFVGILNDLLGDRYGLEAIRYSLLVIGMGKAWGAIHSLLAARDLRADLDRASAT